MDYRDLNIHRWSSNLKMFLVVLDAEHLFESPFASCQWLPIDDIINIPRPPSPIERAPVEPIPELDEALFLVVLGAELLRCRGELGN